MDFARNLPERDSRAAHQNGSIFKLNVKILDEEELEELEPANPHLDIELALNVASDQE